MNTVIDPVQMRNMDVPQVMKPKKQVEKVFFSADQVHKDLIIPIEKKQSDPLAQEQDKSLQTERKASQQFEEIPIHQSVPMLDTYIQFRMLEKKDPETGAVKKELVVFVINKNTKEVIRQIPPEDYRGELSRSSNLPTQGLIDHLV
ncbi:MAG: flagellar protein FlaG [Candidatus Aureabacteria bacterium]|nr:flagellar protein FlaG [Candidatus Auribacterota bacterium]